MTLEKHLGDSRRAAKVSVDLEGRVHVPKIIGRTILQQVTVEHIGMIAIVQTSPLIEFPAHAPSGSAVAAMLKHYARGLSQVGSSNGADLTTGMQSEEMVNMTMLVFRVIYIGAPLLQLSVATNLIGNQAVNHVLPFPSFVGIYLQDVGGLNCFREQFAHYSVNVGYTFVNASMFGRGARCSSIGTIGLFPEEVGSEAGGSPDDGIAFATQPFAVAGVVVIIPQMSGQPWTGGRTQIVRHGSVAQRSRKAEWVGRDGSRPSTSSPITAGRLFAGFHLRLDVVNHGLHTFQQVVAEGGPVVHLDIDVVVVIAMPRAVNVVEPNSLQVGGQRAGSGTCNEQVAAKLEIERLEIGIVTVAAIVGESLRGGFREVYTPIAETEVYMVEERLVVGQVAFEQFLVVHLRSGLHPRSRGFLRLLAYVGQRVVVVRIEVHAVVGIGCEQEGHFLCSSDGQRAVGIAHATACYLGANQQAELHLVIVEATRIFQSVPAPGNTLARSQWIVVISELEVLHTLSVGTVTHHQYVFREGAEALAKIAHAGGTVGKGDARHGAVEREDFLVTDSVFGLQSALNVQLAQGGESAEAERVFILRFV